MSNINRDHSFKYGSQDSLLSQAEVDSFIRFACDNSNGLFCPTIHDSAKLRFDNDQASCFASLSSRVIKLAGLRGFEAYSVCFVKWTQSYSLVHVNTYKKNDLSYTCVIPLEINQSIDVNCSNREEGVVKTILFKQYCFDEGRKVFCHGWENYPKSNHVKPDQDYRTVLYKSRENFPKAIWQSELSHMPYSCLNGLSIEGILPWKVGAVYYWAAARLHAANTYQLKGVKQKSFIQILLRPK